ncbi:MAG TPA: DUF3108 domain-containing protein [Bacteroidia bacterium]|nr:DUF3108 domain-containing protein [Bacteroidia bacterium]
MKALSASLFLWLIPVLSPVKAEDVGPPSWMQHITRLPPGDHANLRPVSLQYTLDWNHRVNAGRVGISIVQSEETKGRFVGDAEGRSTGFARILYPYDFQARSIVDRKTLRPLTFQLTEKERGSENSYDIVFESKRQLFTTTSKQKDEVISNTGRFGFDFGQDALSSAFYLRSQPLNDGDQITMVVTPFNRPYLASFEVIGRESHKIKGKTYNAIKLEAKVGKVNPDLTIKTYEKVKRTTLWFTDDEYRIPLEMQSQLAFGFVSARLDELKWID